MYISKSSSETSIGQTRPNDAILADSVYRTGHVLVQRGTLSRLK